ncbi:MAG: type IX secretion system outer membrane channel protein PorV [Chlorobi bacterium]|nr:type IX secretion system outer membrane channel protein PorV [Chlorobiota bacterium]
MKNILSLFIKNHLSLILFLTLAHSLTAQNNDTRVITTAVPFLLISPDARASGMGDQGVATTPDAYSQYWNPAKYNFMDKKFGFGVSYTPYLSRLINDINIVYLTHFARINERSAYGISLRYFGLGEINLADINGKDMGTVSPNEFSVDGSYGLMLSPNFSMAVSMRFILSDLKLETSQADATAAKDFAVDLAGFYQSDDFDLGDGAMGRYRLGFNIQNIGPKIKYYNSSEGDFLPANLKLGAGFDYDMDAYNSLRFQAETNKLLVPTPPVRNDTTGAIIAGKDDNVSWTKGIFQSFNDAPGGFNEELKEFNWSLAAEYAYMKVFMVRAGYFHESKIKGKRQFLTLGAGFKYNYLVLDVSYLFSTSQIRTPLDGTMRFSLTFFVDKINGTQKGEVN